MYTAQEPGPLFIDRNPDFNFISGKNIKKEYAPMRKALEVTKMAVATVKAFVEYQIFHRKNKNVI